MKYLLRFSVFFLSGLIIWYFIYFEETESENVSNDFVIVTKIKGDYNNDFAHTCLNSKMSELDRILAKEGMEGDALFIELCKNVKNKIRDASIYSGKVVLIGINDTGENPGIYTYVIHNGEKITVPVTDDVGVRFLRAGFNTICKIKTKVSTPDGIREKISRCTTDPTANISLKQIDPQLKKKIKAYLSIYLNKNATPKSNEEILVKNEFLSDFFMTKMSARYEEINKTVEYIIEKNEDQEKHYLSFQRPLTRKSFQLIGQLFPILEEVEGNHNEETGVVTSYTKNYRKMFLSRLKGGSETSNSWFNLFEKPDIWAESFTKLDKTEIEKNKTIDSLVSHLSRFAFRKTHFYFAYVYDNPRPPTDEAKKILKMLNANQDNYFHFIVLRPSRGRNKVDPINQIDPIWKIYEAIHQSNKKDASIELMEDSRDSKDFIRIANLVLEKIKIQQIQNGRLKDRSQKENASDRKVNRKRIRQLGLVLKAFSKYLNRLINEYKIEDLTNEANQETTELSRPIISDIKAINLGSFISKINRTNISVISEKIEFIIDKNKSNNSLTLNKSIVLKALIAQEIKKQIYNKLDELQIDQIFLQEERIALDEAKKGKSKRLNVFKSLFQEVDYIKEFEKHSSIDITGKEIISTTNQAVVPLSKATNKRYYAYTSYKFEDNQPTPNDEELKIVRAILLKLVRHIVLKDVYIVHNSITSPNSNEPSIVNSIVNSIFRDDFKYEPSTEIILAFIVLTIFYIVYLRTASDLVKGYQKTAWAFMLLECLAVFAMFGVILFFINNGQYLLSVENLSGNAKIYFYLLLVIAGIATIVTFSPVLSFNIFTKAPKTSYIGHSGYFTKLKILSVVKSASLFFPYLCAFFVVLVPSTQNGITPANMPDDLKLILIFAIIGIYLFSFLIQFSYKQDPSNYRIGLRALDDAVRYFMDRSADYRKELEDLMIKLVRPKGFDFKEFVPITVNEGFKDLSLSASLKRGAMNFPFAFSLTEGRFLKKDYDLEKSGDLIFVSFLSDDTMLTRLSTILDPGIRHKSGAFIAKSWVELIKAIYSAWSFSAFFPRINNHLDYYIYGEIEDIQGYFNGELLSSIQERTPVEVMKKRIRSVLGNIPPTMDIVILTDRYLENEAKDVISRHLMGSKRMGVIVTLNDEYRGLKRIFNYYGTYVPLTYPRYWPVFAAKNRQLSNLIEVSTEVPISLNQELGTVLKTSIKELMQKNESQV
jgi:hypothetical protein